MFGALAQTEELLLAMTLLPSGTMGMSDFSPTLRRPQNVAYSEANPDDKKHQKCSIYTRWYQTKMTDDKPAIYVNLS